MKYIAFSFVFITLFLCSCSKSKPETIPSSHSQAEIQDTLKYTPDENVSDTSNGKESTEVIDSTKASRKKITEQMAYDGVNNYCQSRYDWSIAKDNPSIMYVKMGEETESEFQVIFRSYTGAFVYFYVDKTSVTTRIVEYSPTVDIKEEAGTIDIFDYLEKVK